MLRGEPTRRARPKTPCLRVEVVEGGFHPLGEPEEWQEVIDRAAGIGERRVLRLGEFTARYRVRTPDGEVRHYLVAERPGGSHELG